jgi:hypothetical protein
MVVLSKGIRLLYKSFDYSDKLALTQMDMPLDSIDINRCKVQKYRRDTILVKSFYNLSHINIVYYFPACQ